MSLLGLTSCGQVDECTYPYPETSVLFDDFHITKTIYLSLIHISEPTRPY